MVYLYTKLSKEELERNTYIEEVKEIGLQTGIEQNQKMIVKEMIKYGLGVEDISKISKLSIFEIEKIKEDYENELKNNSE